MKGFLFGYSWMPMLRMGLINRGSWCKKRKPGRYVKSPDGDYGNDEIFYRDDNFSLQNSFLRRLLIASSFRHRNTPYPLVPKGMYLMIAIQDRSIIQSFDYSIKDSTINIIYLS